MNILYLGSFFPDCRYEEILLDSIGVIQNAGDTYQKALLEGFTNNVTSYDIITSPLLGSYPQRYKRIFFRGNSFTINKANKGICCSFVNLSLYKIFSRYISAKKQIEKWATNCSGEKYIVLFSLDFSLLRASYEIKQLYPDLKICLIVTDLFKFSVIPKSIFSKSIMEIIEKKSLKYIKAADSFVLLSKYMKDELLVGNRPCIVIEGIYSHIDSDNTCEKETLKTILYSGTLAKEYGIVHLLNAFSAIKKDNYRLWICGEGDAKDEIKNRAKIDSRILYFGQLRREEVLKLQKKATVLVNPRFSTSEFTKFSFPSKTMEYLASGTPTIMHDLKCLPNEYLDHLYIASDESDLGLMKTIIEVCEISQQELNAIGERAKEFILTEKNSNVQIRKILDMLDYEK